MIDWTKSRRAFGIALGVRPSELDELVRRKEGLYLAPLIKEREGRPPRRIDRPSDRLKAIQRRLKVLIDERVCLPSYLHGSIKGRSSKTNATPHRGKSCVVRVDVRDFFPSITANVVETALRRQLRASRQVADLAAALLTRVDERDPVQTFLPQGSPASSVVANLVLDRVDRRVKECADRFEVEYTRYVDDITVSGDRARDLIAATIGLLQREGLRVSRRKLTVTSRGGSQVVTGVTVNRKLAPRREFREVCMALVQEAEAASPARRKEILVTLRGKLAYARGLEGTFPDRLAKRLERLEAKDPGMNGEQG